MGPVPRRFLAEVRRAEDGTRVAGLFAPRELTLETELPHGTIVRVTEASDASLEIVAAAGSARASMVHLLAARGLDPEHPPDVMQEVQTWRAAPGVDDVELDDQRAIAYVTVDGPETRDLDQALYVARDGTGFVVRYAIADAAFYVRPGTAIFDEALRRGASYYLPGLNAPMLPRELSEGLVSLNAGADRRAIVFEMHIDAEGECTNTRLVRARVHSRMKLTFEAVQALLDARPGHGIDDPDVVDSLQRLRDVGELRIARASARGVVAHRNAEIRVDMRDSDGMDFVVFAEPRNAVERYGEQLSLLCNVEGARFLRRAADAPGIQAIYRIHDAPDAARLDELQAMFDAVVRSRRLPSRFHWDRKRQSLARFLHQLPIAGEHARVTKAFQRQAVMVNVRSSYSSEPGPHFGIGADVYARFSAPMREIVGVFVHKEVVERLEGQPPNDDEELRRRVIEQANLARERQRDLTREANRLALDRIFAADVAVPVAERPVRTGTVMGLRGGKIYVQLDEPPVDVKVYAAALDPSCEIVDDGAALRGDRLESRLGDTLRLRVSRRDRSGHWLFDLVDA